MIKEQFSLVEYLIQRLYLEGIEDIVISPGSRNAPIIEALVCFNKFKLHSIIDERSAAFFALGCTIQSKKPSVLLCTSGSAVLNYLPAISEAFYQGRSLIVISADRPESFVGQMAGQTIHQQNSLGSFVKSFQQLSSKDELRFIKRKIEDGIASMNKGLNGPIHFNIPFEEPFYGHKYKFNHEVKKVEIYNSVNPLDKEVEVLKASWDKASKIIILVGCLDKNKELNSCLNELSKDERLVILCEATSNLTIENSFVSIDNLVTQIDNIENTSSYEPDLLITLGRNVVSKKIKALLSRSNIKEHWSFDEEEHMIDTYGHLSHKISYSPASILSKLKTQEKGYYNKSFQKLENHSREIQTEYLKNLDLCDYKAFDVIFRQIPKDSVVHLANSSVIRYANLFDLRSKDIICYANRGTSGIDGSTSTAVGYSRKSDKLNILITGDISFLYDSNALWNNDFPDNLRIIVINNGGGGIFDIVPGAKDSPVKEEFLKCENNWSDFQNLFGFDLLSITSITEMKKVNLFLNSEKLIFEIDSSGAKNEELLTSYNKGLSFKSNM